MSTASRYRSHLLPSLDGEMRYRLGREPAPTLYRGVDAMRFHKSGHFDWVGCNMDIKTPVDAATLRCLFYGWSFAHHAPAFVVARRRAGGTEGLAPLAVITSTASRTSPMVAVAMSRLCCMRSIDRSKLSFSSAISSFST